MADKNAGPYRRVYTRMWHDEKFKRLSTVEPSGQALWLYLLTNPDTMAIPGLYRSGRAQMAEALGWDVKGFDKAFAEVFAEGLAEADWNARVVWVPKAVLHNPPANPNVVKAWSKCIPDVPDCELKNKAVHAVKEFLKGFAKGFQEAFGKGFAKEARKGSRKQEQEQEQEQKEETTSSQINLDKIEADAITAGWGPGRNGNHLAAAKLLPITTTEHAAAMTATGREHRDMPWAYYLSCIRRSREGPKKAADPTAGWTPPPPLGGRP